METAIQRAVRDRAKHRCEYCHFPEALAEVPFHCDHVIARQHGGPYELQNLALACCFCNRYKGPNLAGIDPESREADVDWPCHYSCSAPQSDRCRGSTSLINERRRVSIGLMKSGAYTAVLSRNGRACPLIDLGCDFPAVCLFVI